MPYKDREKARAYARSYYRAHSEEICAKSRLYREANPEKTLASNAAYRAAHREELLVRSRIWNRSHRDRKAAHGKKFRDSSGFITYAFWDGDTCLYVGSGRPQRYYWHRHGSPWYRDDLTWISYEQPSQAHARREEFDWIIRFRPLYNKDGVKGLSEVPVA